jgi:hypothetical protein
MYGHGCNLAYQFVTGHSSEMMNDFPSVASSPPDQAIAAS